MPNSSPDEATALRAKRRNVDALMRYPNVCGVGVGYREVVGHHTEELCVRVYVVEKLPEHQLKPVDVVPRIVDGVQTDVVQREFKALYGKANLPPSARKQRFPIELVGGVSIGSLRVTAGTLGATVFDRRDGRHLLLSNWHILCGSLDCAEGEAIVQPGPFDGGTNQDVIARLTRVALSPHVDCAVAEVIGDRYVLHHISGIGSVESIGRFALGQQVKKSGRTTGLTIGTVSDLSADLNVNGYPEGFGRFVDQVIVDANDSNPVSLGGDSGSLVVDDNNAAVGLLFAGPVIGGAFFVANPIQDVIDALDIEIRTGLTEIEAVTFR